MDINTLSSHIKPLDLSVQAVHSSSEEDYFKHYNLNIEKKYPDVKHYFGHFPSGRFEIVAHYYQVKNATQTCFILHGYYDHSGLYSHIIEYCIQKNFSVVIYDLPGHGLSTGKQACIGDFADYQVVLRDVLTLFAQYAPKPWHVIAQSTGAAIVMEYLLSERAEVFSKVVLLAPLVRPIKWRFSLIVYELVKYFFDRIPRSFSLNSNDEDFIDFVKKKDQLQAQHLSMRWVGSLKKWIKHFKNLESCGQSLLVIQGKEDKTVDWKFNIPVIKDKFPESKILYLQQGRHHLANEGADIRAKMFSAMDIYFNVTSAPSKTY
ncbi:MAG: alpha/beta hydrolase [Spongiibacteraceae bacterium]|nr:alpha/beta hydrolase [Spongiibacteraceae bacterium]